MPHARPVIVASRCLGLEACRYDGQIIPDDFVSGLRAFSDLQPVCPEVEIGLGVPRDPIQLVGDPDAVQLVRGSDGENLTATMGGFADQWLTSVGPVDGFVLKSRSPSCGLDDAKIHPELDAETDLRGAGLFATAAMQRHPLAAFADEGRLTNGRVRHHFLSAVFTFASFRRDVLVSGGVEELATFHRRNEWLLLTHAAERTPEMRSLVQGAGRNADAIREYHEHLALSLAQPARREDHVDTLEHLAGAFEGDDRETLDALLTGYESQLVPIRLVLAGVHELAQGHESLRDQTYLNPYPIELASPV